MIIRGGCCFIFLLFITFFEQERIFHVIHIMFKFIDFQTVLDIFHGPPEFRKSFSQSLGNVRQPFGTDDQQGDNDNDN